MTVRSVLVALALAAATSGAAQTSDNIPIRIVLDNAGAPRGTGRLIDWSQAQKDANFAHMERFMPGHVVKRGTRVHPLPAGQPLTIAAGDVDAFMALQNVAGLIVVHDGKVRLERYARGFDADGRWTSFSVAKSFTSTLVGAAVRDGYITSIDDPVTRYIPELAGGGYDGVTIAQLLTMTSGVKWSENYADPNSDVVRMYATRPPPGMDPTVNFMRNRPRESEPGTRWQYKTGETNLIGVLVKRATGKPLANYLSEKIWKPYGMQADAYWMTDPSGQEVGGCCLAMPLRDYARMGLMVLGGGKGIVGDGWFAAATAPREKVGRPGFGYGYQWWTYPGGRFGGQGLYGQSITIDPATKTVIAIVGATEKTADPSYGLARRAFESRLIDSER